MSDTAYPDHVDVLDVLIEVEDATVRRSKVLRSTVNHDLHHPHTIDEIWPLHDSGSNADGVDADQKVSNNVRDRSLNTSSVIHPITVGGQLPGLLGLLG